VSFLYAAMVTLALGIAAINFVLDYQRTREDLGMRAEAYADAMATDVRWYVEVARQSLNRAAEGIEHTAAASELSAALRSALSDLPEGVVIAVYDASGRSRGILGRESIPVDVSDRYYFQELRDGSNWIISHLIVDRVTGQKTFAVGRALRDEGAFEGAAVAYAPMDVLSKAWLGVGGRQSNAFLVHRDGWITARLPPVDSEVYDQRMGDDFVARFTGAPSGQYWAEVSPIDGVARVLGYSEVPSTPLVAVIGLDPRDAISAFWRRVVVTLAILAPILLLLGLVSWRMRSLIVQQEDTAEKLTTSLARNEGLLLEIHHRVKNNLQSVLSLVRTQVKDPERLAEIEPRKVIYASSENIRLETEIANVDIHSDMVMPLGQLVNEVIINAVKYGFSDGRPGVIRIGMTVDERGLATLTIHNNGAPMPKEANRGLGSRLLSAFAAQLRGTLETTSDAGGVTVELKFPIANAAGGAA
jgi:two-component sensor histidine kinase